MKYQQLIESITRFGVKPEDICNRNLGISSEKICKNVIIAPWWEPDILPELGKAVNLYTAKSSSLKVWNISSEKINFSYIKTGIGAPVLMDTVLTLGLTQCERIIFIGSAGGLEKGIKIGGISVPIMSMSGEGAGRYIATDDLKDIFNERVFPDAELTERLVKSAKEVCMQKDIDFYKGRVFSVDTIFAQYVHLEKIKNNNCNLIEMETAAAFRAAKLAKIKIAALLSISDNTIESQTIIGKRSEEIQKYRHYTRKVAFPKIIMNVFKKK